MNLKPENSPATLSLHPNSTTLFCHGYWNLTGVQHLESQFKNISLPPVKDLAIDAAQINDLDTSGVLELQKLLLKLEDQGIKTQVQGLNSEQQKLFALVSKQVSQIQPLEPTKTANWLVRLGKKSTHEGQEAVQFLSFTGEMAMAGVATIKKPKRFHLSYLFSAIETTGFQALPIIALLSFMIGVVLAYQMGLQLRTYGANIFIVDLLGLAVLREFGSLLTAIIVAGRSGSAFTAQLGTMKLNEEIDALTTMGLQPTQLLILPRLLGLVITMPLLTIWADFFGVVGGMVMAKSMLNISYYEFLIRFQHQITLSSLMIGIGKAPVFALIIASIGCFQGMQVKDSAQSVGERTTKSVVQAIFMIIIADAIFSVIFSKLGI